MRNEQSKKKIPDDSRKKRISRYILLADIALVILILLYFSNKKDYTPYSSSLIRFSGIEAGISMTRVKPEGNYIFSLTLTPSENRGGDKICINKGTDIGGVEILRNKKIIAGGRFSAQASETCLDKDNPAVFFALISHEALDEVFKSENIPDPALKSLISFNRRNITLDAVVRLNIFEEVSAVMNFTHEEFK